MNQNVLLFPVGRPPHVGHFVRVGFKYRQFEHLLAAGRMPIESAYWKAAS